MAKDTTSASNRNRRAGRKSNAPNRVAIYQAKSGKIEFRGDFERDTVWGNLNQIADLFGRDKSVISRHINNIFKAGELMESATVAKIATVQKEGNRQITREIEYYNLDMMLSVGYADFKTELIKKGEATELFAQEKSKESLSGILGNVFQSAFGRDVYPSVEEKAAHLLYFTVKNHPFNDGNKRTGAFSFIWLLQKARFRFQSKITAQTLTALTLLIAESNAKEKDKIIGLVLLLLKS